MFTHYDIPTHTLSFGWAKPRIISVVIVRQANREVQYLNFIDSASANFAINLLLKQVDVISAVRGTDYEVPT